MSGLLALISQPVCINMSYKIVTSSLSVTVWGSCSYLLFFCFDVKFLQNVNDNMINNSDKMLCIDVSAAVLSHFVRRHLSQEAVEKKRGSYDAIA